MTTGLSNSPSARAGNDEPPPTPIYGYRKFWAECLGPAPFLPTSRAEMGQLGLDS